MADEIFVGRADELLRFAALLREMSNEKSPRRRGWRFGSAARPLSPEGGSSRVVLVHGLGGSGKSRLLRHFQGMADGVFPDSPVDSGKVQTAWLDWEDEQRDDPASFAGPTGPALLTVLNAVQRAVLDSFGDHGKSAERAAQAFADYREGAARMPEYAARFAELLAQKDQSDSGFSGEDAQTLLKAATSAGLVLGGHPAGVFGFAPTQLAATAQAGRQTVLDRDPGRDRQEGRRYIPSGVRPGDRPGGRADPARRGRLAYCRQAEVTGPAAQQQ